MVNQQNEAVTPEEVFRQAVALHEQGKLEPAGQLYRAILNYDHNHIGSLHNLGILCFQRGEYEETVALTREVLRHRPDLAVTHNTLGVALRHLGRLEEAETCCREALRLSPQYAEAYNTLGDVLTVLGRFREAEACCREAVRLNSDYAEAHNNLATALLSLGRPGEAEVCCRESLRIKPGNAAAHSNLGTVLLSLGRLEEAEFSYREALRLKPDYAEAHSNLGTVLLSLGRAKEAEICYREAVRLKPNYAEAHFNIGNALDSQGELVEAIAAFERATVLQPDCAGVDWFHARKRICDWAGYLEDEARVRSRAGTQAFKLLALSSTPAEQLACARRAAAKAAVPEAVMLPCREPKLHERIRLGYLSADFNSHVVGRLVAGLIEQHDRRGFEVIGYSTSPSDGSQMRARLVAAFDRFVDLSKAGDLEAARLIYADAIDILIDLNGFTSGARTAIPAHRAAPIQVNYLGYSGTMGADFIDYIIVDRFVVPPDQQYFFSERLVHLPDSFLPSEEKPEIAGRTPSRAECGLPEQGFVFCCFNDSYKLTPAFFDIWMRLLRAVPGSVLWLRNANPWAKANLARETAARGIASERVLFAPRLGRPEHLARHRLAGLFLDTLPYNAHATASDALWAGLPVLTCAGNTFAGRVAGSLLRTIGLSELVTTSLEEYEALALRLAHDADLLRRLRARLAENRRTFPLFDTERCTRNLEAAYSRMYQIRREGRSPTAFSIPASGD